MDRFPRRLRNGLLLGTVFLTGVAAVPAVSVLGRHFGPEAAYAQGAERSDTYKWLTLFGDVFERVRADYVDKIGDKELVENALNGMLSGLDPHSAYMNARQFRDMEVQTRGQFGGLGLEVSADKDGLVKVVSPIDDTPAARAGIKAGDLIVQIDGKSIEGMTLADTVDKMRGPPNTKIQLTLKREGVDDPVNVSLIREIIQIHVVKSRMEPNDIAYIRLAQFTEEADSGIRKAITQIKQKIISL